MSVAAAVSEPSEQVVAREILVHGASKLVDATAVSTAYPASQEREALDTSNTSKDDDDEIMVKGSIQDAAYDWSGTRRGPTYSI